MKKLLISSVSAAAAMAVASIAIAQDERAGPGGGAGPGGNAPAARDFGGAAGGGQPGGAAGAQPDRGAPGMAPSAERSMPSAENMGRNAKGDGDKRPGQQRATERAAKDDAAKKAKDKDGNDSGDASTGASGGESGQAAPGSAAGDSKPNSNTAESKQGGAHVTLSADQRSRVNSAFKGHKGNAGVSVNVEVRVGTRLPRSIALLAIPSDVIVVVPDWRRYKYIVVGDTVCIVDPDTFEIIDVIVLA